MSAPYFPSRLVCISQIPQPILPLLALLVLVQIVTFSLSPPWRRLSSHQQIPFCGWSKRGAISKPSQRQNSTGWWVIRYICQVETHTLDDWMSKGRSPSWAPASESDNPPCYGEVWARAGLPSGLIGSDYWLRGVDFSVLSWCLRFGNERRSQGESLADNPALKFKLGFYFAPLMHHTGSGCQEMVIRQCYFLLKMTTSPPGETVHFSDGADGSPFSGLLVSVSPLIWL